MNGFSKVINIYTYMFIHIYICISNLYVDRERHTEPTETDIKMDIDVSIYQEKHVNGYICFNLNISHNIFKMYVHKLRYKLEVKGITYTLIFLSLLSTGCRADTIATYPLNCLGDKSSDVVCVTKFIGAINYQLTH